MTKATRVAFSKTRLEGIPTPESGQAQYHDTGCLGLCLRVSCGGSKTFIRYGKIGGRPTRVFLGRFPEVTVEMARKACQAAAGDIARGLNPHAERLAKRREHTLQGLFDHWMIYAREHKKPKSVEGDDWLFKRYLQPWAGRRLSSIKKADVQTHHAKIGREHGRYAANRMLALLRAMFNKADEVGYTGDNPAKGIKKFSEEKRDRFLQGDELPRFFQSLHQEPEQFRDFFSLALLTGARRANVQAMAWVDVNLDIGLWRIPGKVAKAGETIVVPLSPPAIEILRDRLATANGSPWVFPSKGRTGHLTEPKSAWKRIIDRAGLSDVRLHDLRRTLGSWMTMGGASLPIVGKMLGHRQPATTAIYARLQVDPVRKSVNAATEAMLAAGGVKFLGHDTEGKGDGEMQGR